MSFPPPPNPRFAPPPGAGRFPPPPGSHAAPQPGGFAPPPPQQQQQQQQGGSNPPATYAAAGGSVAAAAAAPAPSAGGAHNGGVAQLNASMGNLSMQQRSPYGAPSPAGAGGGFMPPPAGYVFVLSVLCSARFPIPLEGLVLVRTVSHLDPRSPFLHLQTGTAAGAANHVPASWCTAGASGASHAARNLPTGRRGRTCATSSAAPRARWTDHVPARGAAGTSRCAHDDGRSCPSSSSRCGRLDAAGSIQLLPGPAHRIADESNGGGAARRRGASRRSRGRRTPHEREHRL